jgi:regulator of sirC expression with transglutaminase-like and TPR domain
MFTGRAAADLTPVYKALREAREELRGILGEQNQTLNTRLDNVDTSTCVSRLLRASKRRAGRAKRSLVPVDEKLQGTLETRLRGIIQAAQ